jgi:hypothetical protein
MKEVTNMRHEHYTCDFCGSKLGELPDGVNVGLCILDGGSWVAFDTCQACFDAFMKTLLPGVEARVLPQDSVGRLRARPRVPR